MKYQAFPTFSHIPNASRKTVNKLLCIAYPVDRSKNIYVRGMLHYPAAYQILGGYD